MVPVAFLDYEISVGGHLHLFDHTMTTFITDDNDVYAMAMNNVFTQLFAYIAVLLGFGIISNVYIAGKINDYQTFWSDRSIFGAKGEGVLESKTTVFSRLFSERIY